VGGSFYGVALSEFFDFELKEWYPSDVPAPENTSIEISGEGSFEEKMLEVVSLSYNIKDDSDRLRNAPETFEKQRGDYPLRREFPVFTAECADEEICRKCDMVVVIFVDNAYICKE